MQENQIGKPCAASETLGRSQEAHRDRVQRSTAIARMAPAHSHSEAPIKIPRPPGASSLAVRRVMQGNRKVDTKPEVRLRSALHASGFRFRKSLRIHAGEAAVTADIVFSRARVAVFIDGCFWHSCPRHGMLPKTNSTYWKAKLSRNVQRDARVRAALREAGWTIIRVWEHESTGLAVRRIARQLQRRR